MRHQTYRLLVLIAVLDLVGMSVAAQTCSDKDAQAVFSVLPSCGAGCDSVSTICTASGVSEPECSVCIAALVGDGRAQSCGTGMYCWFEH